MRIALVYPPFLNSIQTTLPEFVNENEGVFHPLGILYLASYLKGARKDCDILVVDAVAEKLDHAGIAGKLAQFSPDLVGVSCWTFSLIDSLEVARKVKKLMPHTFVCLGGPHATIYPEETLAFPEVDFVIAGDGEKPFAELVNQITGARDFRAVSNLYFKRGAGIEKSALSYVEKDLDSLPFPDRSLVPLKNYYSLLDKGKATTTMITSRGCPFRCTFCFQQGTGWRPREIDKIIAEMRQCIGLGIKNFFIFDETFTVNKDRVMRLCNEIRRQNLDIGWSCRSRVDTIDEEVMECLKGSGCKRISFGVESAVEEVLKKLNKNIDLGRAREVFRIAKGKGLVTLADFMIACPGEGRPATRKTIELAIELDPDYAQFSLFTLFPATQLYEEALQKKVVAGDVWLDYARNPGADFKPPLWNIYNESEAGELLALAYRKFYLRFRYIMKRIAGIRSIKEFWYYTKAGLGLLIKR